MKARIIRFLKKIFDWYKTFAYLLFIIAILVVAKVVTSLDRGLQLDALRQIIVLAAAFSLLLPLLSKLHPIIRNLISLIFAFLTSFFIVGDLSVYLSEYYQALVKYLTEYRHALFNQSLLFPEANLLREKWDILAQAVNVLVERLGIWLAAIPEPAYDPVSLNLLWGIGLWIGAVWFYWYVIRRKLVFVGIFPMLITIAIIYQHNGSGLIALFWLLGSALLLKLTSNQSSQEDYWNRQRFSFSNIIRTKTVQNAFILTFILVISTSIITSPTLDEWYDELTNQRASAVSGSGDPESGDGLIDDVSGPSEILGEIAFGRFPNTHLIGSGPELEDTKVLYAHIEDPAPENPKLYYLRATSYDTYTLDGWLSVDKGLILHVPNEASAIEYSPNERLIYQEVSLLNDFVQGNLIYTIGELAAANVPFFTSYHTKFVGETYTDIFASVTQATEYAAFSVAPVYTEHELRDSSLEYPAWITSKYLQIPDEVPDRVYELALRLTATQPTPYDRGLAIEQYLRNFEYSLDIEDPPRYRDIVDYFLFELQTGYCDYYASSMAIMARAAGIPARLATGYLASNYDPERDAFVVTGDQAHSWAELYFTDYGWVVFEATAGRPEAERLADRPNLVEEDIGLKTMATPEERMIDIFNQYMPDNLFVLAGQLLALGAVAVVAFHQFDMWSLKSMKPYNMYSLLYRRLRRISARLHVRTKPTDTPLEFTGQFIAQLNRLISEKFPARLLTATPQSISDLIDACSRAAYAQNLQQESEFRKAIAIWGRLRWQLLLARILLRLRPFVRGVEAFWHRLQ